MERNLRFFFFNSYLFVWLCQVLVEACGLFVAARRLLSICGLQALERAGSVVAAHGLQIMWAVLLQRVGLVALQHVGS